MYNKNASSYSKVSVYSTVCLCVKLDTKDCRHVYSLDSATSALFTGASDL